MRPTNCSVLKEIRKKNCINLLSDFFKIKKIVQRMAIYFLLFWLKLHLMVNGYVLKSERFCN